jgi:uncharacterized SAM-binding protein YcdF (DUF218 family)
MAIHKYGFGFCSHVAPGAQAPANHDVKTGLMLGWQTRQEGMKAALMYLERIEYLVLMGPAIEVQTYRKMLIEMGANGDRIQNLVTSQTTFGNAKDLWRFCDERNIKADDWALITSDYHLERAILTTESHNVAVKHAYGTESLLLEVAMMRGGVKEVEQERERIWSSVDPIEYHARMQWEKQGCAQIRIDSSTYVPKK